MEKLLELDGEIEQLYCYKIPINSPICKRLDFSCADCLIPLLPSNKIKP